MRIIKLLSLIFFLCFNICQHSLYSQWEKREFDKALSYFDKAILIGKELNTNFILCMFLNRKAVLLFQLGKIKDSQSVNNEALEIAKKIDRKNIIFYCGLLSVKIKSISDKLVAINELRMMLNDFKEDYQLAELNYEIFKLDNTTENKMQAFEIYSKLYEKTPKADFKKRIEELKAS
ncbi:MAG: hypothetical protein M3R36_16470 [Bacteroidota bacterium]|nr:hypothetical protein [Bacteroidota bacterium]